MDTLRSRASAWFTRLEPWALFLAFCWMELAFKLRTTGNLWPQAAFVCLFSFAAATIATLACSLLPTRRANKMAKLVLMALFALVCCVEYFVYREFKLFYDLNTVLYGAHDAATGFTEQIAGLVLSPAGITHIALFFAPAVCYGLLGSGEDPSSHADVVVWRAHMARNAAVSTLIALTCVSAIGTFEHTFTDRYSFQTATESFGLITGLAEEVTHATTGGRDVSFSEVATPAKDTGDEEQPDTDHTLEDKTAQDVEQEDEKTKDTVIEFGKSALDIDFDALAASCDGTWAELDRYVASLTPSSKNEMTGRFAGYNLIFVTAEALSAEAIRPDTTPTLYRMATKGIQMSPYFQFDSAGTTGGECANLFGLLATEGGSSVKMCADHNMYLTIGNMLNRQGYDGWAFHNNTYTYYGRDATHNNLGYNHGYMGYGNGMEAWVTWQWPQSDLEMVQGTFENLYGKSEAEPFDVYYMSVSGHSDYSPGENAMGDLHWDEVKDLPYSDPVKGYLAANIELDRAMRYLIEALERKGMADHTLIVIGADHFPYGLDDDGPLGYLPLTSELYGFDVTTYFERDHNRLIMWSASLEDEDPIVCEGPCESIDVLPTLLNLFGCEWDSRLLPGRDVFSDKEPLAFDLNYNWMTPLGTYYASNGSFVPAEGASVPEGYVEARSADVANRISFCHGVLTSDYYTHVFGPRDDVAAVHDAARAKLARSSDKDDVRGKR